MNQRLRTTDLRALGAIIRHARREHDRMLMHVESTLAVPNYGQIRLFHLNHGNQHWQFGYFKPLDSEEFVLPCWARFEDQAVRAIGLEGDRLAINEDTLIKLVRCAPAFLSAVVDLHSVQVPRREQRLPVSLWLKRA